MSSKRKKITTDLLQAHIASITNCSVEYSLLGILGRIHKISLSAKPDMPDGYHSYLKNIFGNISINKDFIPDKRMPNYNKQYVVYSDICNIHLFTDSENFRPPLYIDVIPKENTSTAKYKEFLAYLNDLIPKLKLSSVEYTLDLFCNRASDVEWFFSLLSRCMYVPSQRKVNFLGEDLVNFGDNTRMNAVFRIGDDTKIYERGNDDDKETTGGWKYVNLNRLRLEHTARRVELKKHGLNLLSDFLNNCLFHELNQTVYNFIRFYKLKHAPSHYIWDSYTAKDEKGNSGSFQLEYLRLIKSNRFKNIRQNKVEIQELKTLKNRLLQEMMDFDAAWRDSDTIV